MDASKSSGPYSVPVTILLYISEPLAFLVNDSFASGNFPEKLKLARITPVFKKGSRSDIDNYRPISVLSNFSKLFDKAMYHRLYNYLEEFHFNSVSEKNVRLPMLLFLSLNPFASLLITMNLAVVYL